MFGAVFNTPGDVIRSSSQKAILASEPKKHPFSIGERESERARERARWGKGGDKRETLLMQLLLRAWTGVVLLSCRLDEVWSCYLARSPCSERRERYGVR